MASCKCLHSSDLYLDGRFIVMRLFSLLTPKLMRQQFIVHYVGNHESQASLIGTLQPINVHLLVDDSGEPGPSIKVGVATNGVPWMKPVAYARLVATSSSPSSRAQATSLAYATGFIQGTPLVATPTLMDGPGSPLSSTSRCTLIG